MTFEIISHLNIRKELKEIGLKSLEGIRITPDEGIILFNEAPLSFLGLLADNICRRINGDNVCYIRNAHIEPTNICIHHCRFCSYSARQTGNPWESPVEEMIANVKALDINIRELHITGGVHPSRDIHYYGDLLRQIKEVRPELYVKAYSAVEIDYMIKKAGLSYKDGLNYLKECGLDALPGGGAEIFDETIRKQICDDKTNSIDWLKIHETAHQVGITSNATMLYGHLENYSHRIDHMNRLRTLQDNTNGFNAFIPLKFKNQNNEFSYITETSVIEDLKTFAVSRIFLDNFKHIKSYWPALGKSIAQLSLSFGVDDLDGTINDSTKIYSLAGAEDQNPTMNELEMREMIVAAGKIPFERNGAYEKITT
jgi:aminodeoxyfutalosine synthase